MGVAINPVCNVHIVRFLEFDFACDSHDRSEVRHPFLVHKDLEDDHVDDDDHVDCQGTPPFVEETLVHQQKVGDQGTELNSFEHSFKEPAASLQIPTMDVRNLDSVRKKLEGKTDS